MVGLTCVCVCACVCLCVSQNAPGSATDSPDTARAAVLALGAAWVRAAGGTVSVGDVSGVEVSPLLSYAGEGLSVLVEGKTITTVRLDP